MSKRRVFGQAQQDALEFELMKETAGALGKAGHRLAEAIAAYEAEASPNLYPARRDVLLAEVTRRCFDLLLQRECSGFVDGNEAWVRQNYRVPETVWQQLGRAEKPSERAPG